MDESKVSSFELSFIQDTLFGGFNCLEGVDNECERGKGKERAAENAAGVDSPLLTMEMVQGTAFDLFINLKIHKTVSICRQC